MLPSFFLTKRIEAPQGKTLDLMKPCTNSSYNEVLNSMSPSGAIQYGTLEKGTVIGTKSMANFISLAGGNPGTSSRKTTANSLTTRIWVTLALIARLKLPQWWGTPHIPAWLIYEHADTRSNNQLYHCFYPQIQSSHFCSIRVGPSSFCNLSMLVIAPSYPSERWSQTPTLATL